MPDLFMPDFLNVSLCDEGCVCARALVRWAFGVARAFAVKGEGRRVLRGECAFATAINTSGLAFVGGGCGEPEHGGCVLVIAGKVRIFGGEHDRRDSRAARHRLRVGTMIDQAATHIRASVVSSQVEGGEVQGRLACMHRGAVIQEQVHDLEMPLVRRHVQRRPIVKG